ncbi:MAG: outer membrane lipoprotein carrier protein LolA [Prevotellaceae bacterium]|nr:outer membrane lipoprotein carrier protein LolA [Prevotellaceae bacterium]
MKKTLFTMLMALLCVMVSAQDASYKKAVAKYKNVTSLTAKAVKTKHKASVAKDQVAEGMFYVKCPNKVLITFNKGKDALLMNGTAFTMTVNGRKFKTNSNQNPQFKTFQLVLESIFSGGAVSLSKCNDVSTVKQGNNVVLTIKPVLDKKGSKRQLFTSFVVTIDSKTSELRSLRMNEKRGGYTEYTFSGYKFGAAVADTMFK